MASNKGNESKENRRPEEKPGSSAADKLEEKQTEGEAISSDGEDKNKEDDTDTEVSKGFSFSKEFDIYLTELASPAKSAERPAAVASRLIAFKNLQELASKNGFTVRNLALYKLRPRLSGGFFCLKSSELAEIDSSMTLFDYFKREKQAAKVNEDYQSLTVYWTRKAGTDLKSVLGAVPEPGKVDASDKSGKSDAKPSEKPNLSKPAYAAAIDTKSGIEMEKSSNIDTPYNLKTEDWAHVIEGNELLYAFQVDTEQTEKLKKLELPKSESLPAPEERKPTIAALGGADVTSASSFDSIVPIRRCTRPVFVIHPSSAIGSTKKEIEDANTINAGLFWCNPKSVSTTKIQKVQTSLEQWSLESGMSKNSFEGGLSFPIGKASVGAKFGFERERSHSSKTTSETSETRYTALHTIPAVQINLNETTVLLSPDAEFDIKKLRRERKFTDLLSFFDKYGTLVYQNVTLGGRLYHTQYFSSAEQATESETLKRFKISANASLGVPDLVELKTGGGYEKKSASSEGKDAAQTSENLTWSGIGGNATLSVDPPKWRDSLNDYRTWRPVQYENAIRIDELVGRLPGFSDVPVLFSSILESGVLDRTVIAFPPNGIAANNPTKAGSEFITPKIGMAIDPKTGTLMSEGGKASAQTPVLVPVAPEGYAWAVFSTSRDIKREIRANLQASLNPMVNVSFETPFLKVLRAQKSAFTIMLRWTSRSFKETMGADPQESIVKREADGENAKEIETEWQKDLEAKIEEQKKAATEKHEKEKTEAEQKVKKDADKAEADWIAKLPTIPDNKKTAETTKHEQRKNAAARKAKDDAEKAVAKWKAKLANIEGHKQTEIAKHEQERKDDEQKKADAFIIRSITSQAWIIGVWQVNKARMPETDFDDLKATVIKYFSEPKTIENGCDYISSITTTDMNMDEGSGMEANTTSNKKKKVAKKPSASFHMYASDGPLRDEIHVVDSGSASYAFAAIDRRMNLSSIHIRPVKGEIQAPGGAEFPATSSLNEAALLQIQEARTSMAYLKTCNPSAVTTYVTALEERLDRGKNGYLFKNTPFPTNLFTELDKAEMGLRKND